MSTQGEHDSHNPQRIMGRLNYCAANGHHEVFKHQHSLMKCHKLNIHLKLSPPRRPTEPRSDLFPHTPRSTNTENQTVRPVVDAANRERSLWGQPVTTQRLPLICHQLQPLQEVCKLHLLVKVNGFFKFSNALYQLYIYIFKYNPHSSIIYIYICIYF